MKNIWLVTLFTVRESISKKVFIAFSVFVLAALLVAAYAAPMMVPVVSSKATGTPNNMALYFKMGTANFVLSFGYLLSIFACAGFIPSLLERGTIDLFLSKPVSRAQLLAGKYFGGLLIFFINTFVLIAGIWIIAGFQFSHWDFSFLPLLLVSLFYFAILNGVVLVTGLLTRSSGLSMMTAYMLMFVSPLLAKREVVFSFMQGKDFLKGFINTLYFILPKLHELQDIPQNVAFNRSDIELQIILTSFLFLLVVLYAGFRFFEKSDY